MVEVCRHFLESWMPADFAYLSSCECLYPTDTSHYENVPFEVPDGWCRTTLGEIGTWQAGGTPSRMHKEYYGGNIPWLKTGDLNDGLITTIPEYITAILR